MLVYVCFQLRSARLSRLPEQARSTSSFGWNSCERSLRRRGFAQLLIVRTSYGYTLDKASLLCANQLGTERAEPIAGVHSRRVLSSRA